MSKTANQIKAEKAYQEKQASIADLIASVQRKLNKDAKDEITWASVGSLGHVEELLANINEFLG